MKNISRFSQKNSRKWGKACKKWQMFSASRLALETNYGEFRNGDEAAEMGKDQNSVKRRINETDRQSLVAVPRENGKTSEK